MNNEEKRCKEFMACLGNGKNIYQIEAEEYWEDVRREEMNKIMCDSCEKEKPEVDITFLDNEAVVCLDCLADYHKHLKDEDVLSDTQYELESEVSDD